MSSKSRKIERRLREERKREITKNQMIAIRQMKQLFDSPFHIRFKFCMKLLFRK